jgi:hypothetical protein
MFKWVQMSSQYMNTRSAGMNNHLTTTTTKKSKYKRSKIVPPPQEAIWFACVAKSLNFFNIGHMLFCLFYSESLDSYICKVSQIPSELSCTSDFSRG